MDLVLCPRCGCAVKGAGRQLYLVYCSQCGWNFDAVFGKQNRPDHFPFFLLAGLAGFTLGPALWHSAHWGTIAGITAFLGFFGLLLFLAVRTKVEHVQSLKSKVMANGATDLSSSFPEQIPKRVLAEQERIAAISVPRAVAPDTLTLWCFRILILGAGCLATQAGLSRKESVFGLPWQFEILATLVMLGVAYWAGSRKLQKEPHLELLKTGAVKFVRAHSVGKKSLLPQVTFELWDKQGKPIHVTRQNRSRVIFAGAYIPVFYRPENPEDCLPGCATNYDLVFPKD